MENLFMSAGLVTAIVLLIVGILKLPFKSFKTNHPKAYKATFTLISMALVIGLSIVNELYILCGEIVSVDFAILVSVVFAGVFGGYGGIYEGLAIKQLARKLIDNIKEWIKMSKDKKALKHLKDIESVDEAIKFLETKQDNGEV